jgi:hypothetical protein
MSLSDNMHMNLYLSTIYRHLIVGLKPHLLQGHQLTMITHLQIGSCRTNQLYQIDIAETT